MITSFEHPICCPDAVLNCTGMVLSRCTSLEFSCLTTSLKANSTMACERAVQNLAALLACLLACLLTASCAAQLFVRPPFEQWCTWTFSVKQMLLAACSQAPQPFTKSSNNLGPVRHFWLICHDPKIKHREASPDFSCMQWTTSAWE